jgi:hypothetical protein
MTESQHRTVAQLLCELEPRTLHHGDCIGADAQAHAIARSLGIDVIIHPPSITKKRAFCVGAQDVLPPLPYLMRNDAIIEATDVLVATPSTEHEQQRSGTWATIRHALKRFRKPVYIIWPNGELRMEVYNG